MENMTISEALRTISGQNNWKDEKMRKICMLSLEYLMLDGLEYAKRSSDIPFEIMDILATEATD